ncbi:uncharacterized protein J3D65DRAFT_477718 [Phyllosticta citribraziliensis]|uniref:Aminoglycoside phosphotransferase domain-containing protein n=1 Tax=Phyllosticta citribraziliensis TaxID=989973 RepID=A0ABR1LG79_9PEZI
MAIHLSSVSTYSGDAAAAEAKAMGKNHEHDRRDSKADEADWQHDCQLQSSTLSPAKEEVSSAAATFRSCPDFNVANSDSPAARAYWDEVLDLCTPATLIHAPLGYDDDIDGGELIGRFIYAVGNVVVKTGVMSGKEVQVKRKNYDGVDQNEVEAVALVKKKCGNAVPVAEILFAGKLRGSSTLIQRRIEGPTLAAAWPSLTICQRKELKQQTRQLIAKLAHRVGSSPTGKRAYLIDDYAAIWARNLTPGERRVMLPPAPPSRPSAVRANSGTVESVRRRDLWATEGEQQEAGQGLRSKSFSGGKRDVFTSGNGFTTDGFTRGDVFASGTRKPDITAAGSTTGIGFRRGNGFTRGDAFSKPPSLSMTSANTPARRSIFTKPTTLSLADSAIITSPPSSAAASPSISSPRTTTERDADAMAADPDTSFTHNDLSPSNIIISPDFERPAIHALIDWEQAGWIGVKTAGMIHRRWRADIEGEEDAGEGGKVGWKDLYEFEWRDEEHSGM